MLVRSVEFQENFRLVTLEASRQQSVLNREATVASESASSALVEQRSLDQTRPIPSEESESSRVIDSEARQESRPQGQRSGQNDDQPEQAESAERGLPTGNSIDLLA